MSYEIILFDLDDTLIDFTASETEGLKRIYEHYYHPADWSLFYNTYRQVNDELWKRVGAKENALMPGDICYQRFKDLNEQLPCSASFEVVADNYTHYLSEFANWFPNVKQAIQFLHQKGHILGIITNGLTDVQGKKGQRLGLNDWFDCFVVSDEVGIAKPNKEIFDIALEEIASKRNQPIHTYDKSSMLMVGDSIISDGHGAMNFGINYCYINNELTTPASEANITYHLNSVAQLPHCIGYEAEYEHYLKSM